MSYQLLKKNRHSPLFSGYYLIRNHVLFQYLGLKKKILYYVKGLLLSENK